MLSPASGNARHVVPEAPSLEAGRQIAIDLPTPKTGHAQRGESALRSVTDDEVSVDATFTKMLPE